MPRSFFPAVLFVFLIAAAVAQQSPAPAAPAPAPASVDNDFVQKQFGSTCTLMPGPSLQTADLDGDGTEDAIIIARCTNPMLDQAEHGYKVIDPYDNFFGYGDPKVTTQFATEEPERRGLVLLVIHGNGAEAWRSATPKAKFMIINLPFKQIMVKKLQLRKKTVMAIYADEVGGAGTVSATFWDGKNYKYQPMGSNME